MKTLFVSVSACLLFVAFGARASVLVRQPIDPACSPTPSPLPTATPRPTPTPVPSPTPLPPPKPKPPANLEPDGPNPVSSGSAVIDHALKTPTEKSVLPLWHGYPWQKISHPLVWTAYAVQAIQTNGQKLLTTVPKDIEWYCPKYASLDQDHRVVFWTRLISVLAEQESSFDPLEITFEPSIGKGVFSTGLLMLSLDSAQSEVYGCDMIRNQDDLFQWRRNMTCAIKVMNHFVGQDQAITWNREMTTPHSWQGISRYWEPFRDPRIKNPVGRLCLDEVVSIRAPDWAVESIQPRHASYLDAEYKRAGEKKTERFLRLVNELPFCQ